MDKDPTKYKVTFTHQVTGKRYSVIFVGVHPIEPVEKITYRGKTIWKAPKKKSKSLPK